MDRSRVHGAVFVESAECLHTLDQRSRVEPGAYLVVDQRDRSDAARPKTINHIQREGHRNPPRFPRAQCRQRVGAHQGSCPRRAHGRRCRHKHAPNCARAASNGIARKTSPPMNPAQRNARVPGDEHNRLLRQIPIQILRPLQNRDERPLLARELLKNTGKAGQINVWWRQRRVVTRLAMCR